MRCRLSKFSAEVSSLASATSSAGVRARMACCPGRRPAPYPCICRGVCNLGVPLYQRAAGASAHEADLFEADQRHARLLADRLLGLGQRVDLDQATKAQAAPGLDRADRHLHRDVEM